MVELYLKGKVENVIKGKDFKREDGTVRKGSVKLQFITLDDVRGLQTVDVSVPGDFEDVAFGLKGKDVNIPVEVFVSNNKIYYRAKSL